MSPWLGFVTQLCLLLLFATAGLCLYRMVVGPRAADRAVAFDTLSAVIVGMVYAFGGKI